MEVSSDQKSPAVQYRLVDVTDKELYLADITDIADIENNLQVRMNGSHSVTPDEKLFVIIFTVMYLQKEDEVDKSDRQVFLKYTVSASFSITNFEEVILLKDDDHFSLPGELVETATGLIIGTMRGMLIEKTANTKFKRLYLPIVDPRVVAKQLFSDD